jgi:DEAD/DEAH box helicase domain-containing protein
VLFDRFSELVELAHSVATSCPCTDGCPGCIMLSRRPDGNDDLSKAGALALLESLR